MHIQVISHAQPAVGLLHVTDLLPSYIELCIDEPSFHVPLLFVLLIFYPYMTVADYAFTTMQPQLGSVKMVLYIIDFVSHVLISVQNSEYKYFCG